MKICRFDDQRIGVLRHGQVFDVTERLAPLLAVHAGAGDPLIAALPRLPAMLVDLSGCTPKPQDQVRWLAPVAQPGKIVAAPVNYHAHIAEMQANNVSPGFNITDIGKAGLFLKATSSLVGASQGIAQRFLDRRTDFEVELVVVIGRRADRVAAADALQYVAGYSLGLDITVRGTEERSFRKSIDSYTVLGPWLTTADELPGPGQLQITLHQNGELRQRGHTSDLVYGVARLIEFASSFYTLEPGDLLYTGTPEGVGAIRPGDRLRAECEALGAMDVTVRAA
ncbi:fumarylacetoacetate hydrolase family protein [Aquincola sp. S2]|uniref:Fumarylacetoacetate hydrolase family protein n=1 Tax=Pseudaquabacterium terrae TaxID=2732868 RepID=A0ABX2ETA2_9BURK|nr:fumarylacetoacetate hydrolase family protein [Aquabacterium terrae]NRF71868.1 fumarylacetoacetate hydrolase family protein [Aquabacterium terrae]